jgi:light-regulated signal transduction histidine kinase (bacteriophytochrome)
MSHQDEHPAVQTPDGAEQHAAIAQRMVERHAGAIGVESTVGQGSRFWFSLRAA